MKSKITFNTKDLCAIYSISAPRLSQIRNGEKAKSNKNAKGKSAVLNCEPILKKGEDWTWKNSQVVYYMSAIKKLNNQTKKGKSLQKNLGLDFETLSSDFEVLSLLLKHSNIDRAKKLELNERFSQILKPAISKETVKSDSQPTEMSSTENGFSSYFKKFFNWFGGKSETPIQDNLIQENLIKGKKVKIRLNKKEIILSEKDANEIIRIIESSSKNESAV